MPGGDYVLRFFCLQRAFASARSSDDGDARRPQDEKGDARRPQDEKDGDARRPQDEKDGDARRPQDACELRGHMGRVEPAQ